MNEQVFAKIRRFKEAQAERLLKIRELVEKSRKIANAALAKKGEKS